MNLWPHIKEHDHRIRRLELTPAALFVMRHALLSAATGMRSTLRNLGRAQAQSPPFTSRGQLLRALDDDGKFRSTGDLQVPQRSATSPHSHDTTSANVHGGGIRVLTARGHDSEGRLPSSPGGSSSGLPPAAHGSLGSLMSPRRSLQHHPRQHQDAQGGSYVAGQVHAPTSPNSTHSVGGLALGVGRGAQLVAAPVGPSGMAAGGVASASGSHQAPIGRNVSGHLPSVGASSVGSTRAAPARPLAKGL